MNSKEIFHKELLSHLALIRKYRNQKGSSKIAETVKDDILPLFEDFFGVSIDRSPRNPLNFMESLCLALFFLGERQKQVAHWLNLSISTVNTYETNIRTKLGVTNRQQACIQAQNMKLVILKVKN